MLTTQEPERIGVFNLGPLLVALPTPCIQEVVPDDPLIALPGDHPALLGGLDLRGTLVPVYSLFALFKQAEAPAQTGSIVIARHQKQIIGLRISDVTDIYTYRSEQFSKLNASTLVSVETAHFIDAAIQVPELNQAVYWLNLQSIFSQPGMFCAEQEDTLHRQSAEKSGLVTTAEPTADHHDHLLLLKTGSVQFALSANDIFATVLNPVLKPSTMSGAFCIGSITYSGIQVPAIELSKLCGIFSTDHSDKVESQQAFLIRYADGFLAFMVDNILDVQQNQPDSVRHIPKMALAQPEFVIGMIDIAGWDGSRSDSPYFLQLDTRALLAHSNLQQLARLIRIENQKEANQILNLLGDQQNRIQMYRVVTYILGEEIATPIEQITEIIPWDDRKLFGKTALGAGLMIERDKVITLYPLHELLGYELNIDPQKASVLVVEAGNDHVGFVVPDLQTIEEATQAISEDEIIQPPVSDHCRVDVVWSSTRILNETNRRMLCQLDLRDLANKLRQQTMNHLKNPVNQGSAELAIIAANTAMDQPET